MSTGVGLVGLAGLIGWVIVARHYGLAGPGGALVALVACGLPMILWSVVVDKVHLRPSTGLDWSRPLRPWRETIDISLTKLAGLWATWGLIAIFYALCRWYWQGQYLFAMELFERAAPFVVILSIPYILWIDRRLADPRDGAFAFGSFLLGQPGVDRPALEEHFRSWGVKAFFTAFMISIVPGNFAEVIARNLTLPLADPVAITQALISAMFLIDVVPATVGYLLTCRPLDAHIRSANPFVAGWAAALICYPPFIMMGNGAPLDYHQGTQDWHVWFAGHTILLALIGTLLVILTAIYAWATVAFGLRFSNLTNRGILTHGPYRWSKHPAYLSKNLFWWLLTMPFLSVTGSLTDMIRNTVTLGAVSGVYYWRARTEERHLSADPAYVAYAAWMERNAPLPRLRRWVMGQGSADITG